MEEKLQSLGLNKNDAKIYLAINELGLCTTTDISKKTKIHRANIYDAVQSLNDRGLISYILKGNTKHFQANDPRSLISMIREKEDIARAVVPELELMQHLGDSKSQAFIQEGLPAAKRTIDTWLDFGTEILVMGVTAKVGELAGAFMGHFHKRRVEKGVMMKHIYNSDAHDRMKLLSKMKHTEVKFFPEKYNSPFTTSIVGDEVTLMKWDKHAITITIKNQEIADAYRNYFNLMWKDAETYKIEKKS